MIIRLFFTVFLLSIGCARGPLKKKLESMRLQREVSEISDDGDISTLRAGLLANRLRWQEILEANPNQTELMQFGPEIVSVHDYILSLKQLEIVAAKSSLTEWQSYLLENFNIYEVYGGKQWGEVLVTGYYEPIIKAQHKAKAPYTQPLYGLPKTMVAIQMDKFAQKFSHLSVFADLKTEQKTGYSVLRGRIVYPTKGNPVELPTIEPFFDRREIDELNLLKDEAPVIAYADPVDSFFLQIQGSGWLDIGSKKIHVGYKAQNGHPYVPIGKYLWDVIPKESMTQQKIEKHLRSLDSESRQQLLNQNPSYVFFQELKSEAVTSFGTEVIAGRTIATDRGLFPKGTLAFLEIEEPIFSDANSDEPVGWRKASRFVFDQDTGGAIRGPARVDLYIGQGESARQTAGVMKRYGRLLYFVPKSEFIAKITTLP